MALLPLATPQDYGQMFQPAPVGTGVLASPLQSPLAQAPAPQDASRVMDAIRALSLKNAALQKALLRAQALREYPGAPEQGQGPGGWAVTAANAFNDAMNFKARQKAAEATAGTLDPLSLAGSNYIEQYLRGQPMKYRLEGYSNFVPPGTPLSISGE